MALEKPTEDDLSKGVHHRQLRKSTSLLALCHSDQFHRKERESCVKLKVMVAGHVEHTSSNLPSELRNKIRLRE